MGCRSGANRIRCKLPGYRLRCRNRYPVWPAEGGVVHAASFRMRRHPSGENPTPPRFGRTFAFACTDRRRPAIIAAFAADRRGLAATAGFRRGVVPSRRPTRCNPGRMAGLPTGRMAFLLSGQERFTRDCFRFPGRGHSALRSFRTVRTAGPAVLKACAFIQSGSPRPSGRAVPFLGGGPHSTSTFSGRNGAGDSPLFSSPAPFPFVVSNRRPLSVSPAGPFAGDFRTFIDLRSGLSRQPNASVRVASR